MAFSFLLVRPHRGRKNHISLHCYQPGSLKLLSAQVARNSTSRQCDRRDVAIEVRGHRFSPTS